MLYKYKIKFFDDINNKSEVAEGYVFGWDDAEATKALLKKYCPKGAERLQLTFINDSSNPVLETRGWLADERRKDEEEADKW